MPKQLLMVTQGRKAQARVTAMAVKTRPRRSKRPSRQNSSSLYATPTMSWAMALKDPWEHTSPPLGFGTLVETVAATAFVRGSIAVNSTDGSFNIILQPQLADMVITSNSAVGTATGRLAVQATNAAGIRTQMYQSRVLAGGLRVYALFPETAASGVLFAGSIVNYAPAQFGSTVSTQDLSGFSSAELGLGTKGARAVILPTDVLSTVFSPATTSVAGNSSNLPSWSSAFVAGQGFPSGTIVWYEAVLQLEGLPYQTASGIGIDVDQVPDLSGSVANDHTTFERAYTMARKLVGNAAVMDGVADLASFAGYPRIARAVSSRFGSGRNWLVSGRAAERQGRESTVVIEEMKEEYPPARPTRLASRLF